MMKLKKIYLALIVFTVVAAGCESLLDADSERILMPDQHQLNTSNDTLYSMIGIFTQLEKLADRYVLLGELRGDLIDVTEYTGSDLLEIYNFNIAEDNAYNQIEDYYAVINNCNYLIQNIDTAEKVGNEKVLYKEFAAAKAIRAWTYMQIAFNYGSVKYYEQPILNIAGDNDYNEYTLQELMPLLIQDLEPFKDIEEPGGIDLEESLNSDKTFFPIQFVLGDLYLWNREYEKAAIEYYNLIRKEYLVNSKRYRSIWTVENDEFTERKSIDQRWWDQFLSGNNELISVLASAIEDDQVSDLKRFTWYSSQPELIVSDVAIGYWDKQIYYNDADVVIEGDLRGDYGSYFSPEQAGGFIDYNQIYKYLILDIQDKQVVSVYRTAMLYLRYAEAVNRAGKPNLAFAVLKHGMNSNTMAVDTIVPRSEKYISYTDSTGTFYNYANFENVEFDVNIGIHARGCGNTHYALDYKIQALGSLTDSIIWVEDKIIEEFALETAFEGNRFQDLMRISFRRNDPAYLADIVSKKYVDQAGMRSKLMDENNWYLP